jgi:hypothetical protein
MTLATAVTSFYFATKATLETGRQTGVLSTPTQLTTATQLTITGITPNSGEAASGKIFIKDLAGTGFDTDTTVKLKKGDVEIAGTEVEAISTTRMQCYFDLAGKDSGAWDVIVTNPGQAEKTLPGGFEIK